MSGLQWPPGPAQPANGANPNGYRSPALPARPFDGGRHQASPSVPGSHQASPSAPSPHQASSVGRHGNGALVPGVLDAAPVLAPLVPPAAWPPKLPAEVPGQVAGLAAGPRRAPSGLSDPRLIAGVLEILASIADQLPDRAAQADVLPLIRNAVVAWTQRLVRQGAAVPAPAELEALAQAVYDQRYGLGPLAAYLRDRDVENVDVNGCDRVWVTYSTGERVAAPPIAASDEAFADMIRTWATRGGQTARDFSAATPLVNVGLVGGARLTATMAVTPRPCLSLRRHGQLEVTLDDLIRLGTLDQVTAAFLAAAVKSRCNIIVTGAVNAGKTTMLRALASEISPSERIATLETEYELFLHHRDQHPDVIAFEAREANSEGAGSVSLHDLIAHALRHNPHRILVGEVRRSEIMPMLEAMNSGQDGSMCTMHANSPVEVFDRILILGLRGGLALTERAIHILVGMAVDLIVQVRKSYDGRRTVRFVSEILEVMPPGDTDRPAVNRLFLPSGIGGRAAAAHTPSPAMLARLEAAGFAPHLLDKSRTQVQQGGWGSRANR